MKEIRSRANPVIKQICSLHTPKGRRTHRQCIAEGVRTCKTMIDGGYILVQLYIIQELSTTALTLCNESMITLVPHHVMEKMSSATTPSGILGVFTIPDSPDLSLLSSGIVLAQLNNPGNVGALIRTCAAMGYRSVVCIDTVDPWSPKAIQSSAGTLAYVTIFQLNWEKLCAHKGNSTLVALVPKGGHALSTLKQKKLLFVVGNEAHGIPERWINECDTTISLAMPGQVESLNAAVAGSIALYTHAAS